jgi:GntR family transcriptional regulator
VTIERIGTASLVKQAHDVLLNAIRRGEFTDGRLPPENDLSATLGVSRTTIRAALQRLEHEGLLSRRRGVGTKVITPGEHRFQLELGRLSSLDDLLHERGHHSTTEVVDVRGEVNASLSEEFGVEADARWHVIEKIWFADGHPAALLHDYIPCTVVPELPTNVELLSTIFRLFDATGPEPIGYAHAEIVPTISDAAIERRLAIPRGSAYVRLWQRHYGVTQRRLAISRLDVNDKFIRFELVRRV